MINSASSIASSASYSLSALNRSTNEISLSINRLSSGNRLVRASDDVAALSISQGLRYEVTALRQALQNSTQADSFLQVAYGGLQTIGDILNEMKSTAVQANSASLTDTERAYLQTSFSSMIDELDSIASNTNFNGISLLDGSLADESLVTTYTNSATAASATLSFTLNPVAAQTVNINNVALTAGANFAVGGSTDVTVANLATAINNSTNPAFSGLSATANLNQLTLTAKTGGALNNVNIVDRAASTTSFTTAGNTTAQVNVFSFSGGLDNGLNANSVRASGTSATSLITAQNSNPASIQFTLSALPLDGQVLNIDNGNGGLTAFTYRNTPVGVTDIQIGTDITTTLQNTIETLATQTGNQRYVLDQIDVLREGNSLTFRSKSNGNPVDLNSAVLDFTETLTNGSLTAAQLNNGTTAGVNAAGVTNEDFIGTLSGFSATYNSADNITAEITVGDYTYSATITDTTPATNTSIRFSSTTAGGGFFDVQLSTSGLAVGNQPAADTYAANLDAAFAGLTFSQNRIASSFNGVNSLVGSTAEFTLGDFSGDVVVDRIDVTAPSGSGTTATIEFDVNGETFRSSGTLGTSIGNYEIIELNSTTTGNKITLRTGNQTIDLSTDAVAATFETTLETSFGFGTGSGTVSFQIGSSPDNKLEFSISSASSEKLFDGADITVDSQFNAATASDALDVAIDRVTGIIANVGSKQQIAQRAQTALENEITNKDAARAALADTDIAFESTSLAINLVRSQSAIAVLSQIPGLYSGLLDVLKAGNA